MSVKEREEVIDEITTDLVAALSGFDSTQSEYWKAWSGVRLAIERLVPLPMDGDR